MASLISRSAMAPMVSSLRMILQAVRRVASGLLHPGLVGAMVVVEGGAQGQANRPCPRREKSAPISMAFPSVCASRCDGVILYDGKWINNNMDGIVFDLLLTFQIRHRPIRQINEIEYMDPPPLGLRRARSRIRAMKTTERLRKKRERKRVHERGSDVRVSGGITRGLLKWPGLTGHRNWHPWAQQGCWFRPD